MKKFVNWFFSKMGFWPSSAVLIGLVILFYVIIAFVLYEILNLIFLTIMK